MSDPASPSDSKIQSGRTRGLKLSLGLAVLLLLAIAVPPFININRFRRSIVQSISEGLGRPVRARAVELTLLPRPAFVLHGFTVAEDPAYGAEPVLVADTVTASLRASTLWHRRVEIATLSFDAPSLNLTRTPAGHWNFETLLQPSSRSFSPRSGRPGASARMPFPYVEAADARINFKLAAEKLPFSLESADLAVWKEPGSEWHLRIKARPVRTDLTVANAGQVRGEAVLQAAGPLENAPVRVSLEWRRVELGQIGRMLQGEEGNWSGLVDWTAEAKGTLASARVSTDVKITEFRRTEFVPAGAMELRAHCQGQYLRNSNALEALLCSAPLESGTLHLRGHGLLPLDTAGIPSASLAPNTQPVATVTLRHVPAHFFLQFFRHVHPGVNPAAALDGEWNGAADCLWAGLHWPHSCVGQVQSTSLALTLPQIDRAIRLSPLTIETSNAAAPNQWQLQPSHVSIDGGPPAILSGTFNPHTFSLAIAGTANLRQAVALSHAFSVPAFTGNVRALQGNVQFALALQSGWLPQSVSMPAAGVPIVQFVPSQWTGKVQVRNAVLTLAVLPGHLQLASAQAEVKPGTVEWTHLAGSYGDVPFDGDLRWRTPCTMPAQDCSRRFDLHLMDLRTASLLAALHASKGPVSLLKIVNPWAAHRPGLPLLNGRVTVDTLSLGKMSIHHAALHLRMAGHRAELLSLAGNAFGGTLSADNLVADKGMGTKLAQAGHSSAPENSGPSVPGPAAVGSAEWGTGVPVYTLQAALTRIRPDSVAALWRQHWGRGVANVRLSLTARGWSSADLAQHAQGRFSIQWTNGALASSGRTWIQFQSWRAAGKVSDRQVLVSSSQMMGADLGGTPDTLDLSSDSASRDSRPLGAQIVSGSVSFAGGLDLKLRPSGILLRGTLDSPTLTAGKPGNGAMDPHP
jgi:AsmA protein